MTTAYHGSATDTDGTPYHSMSRAASDGDFDDEAFEQHTFGNITSYFLKSQSEIDADFHNNSDATTGHSAQAEEGELNLPQNTYKGNDPATDWKQKAWRDNPGYSRRGVSFTVGVLPDANTAENFDAVILFPFEPKSNTQAPAARRTADNGSLGAVAESSFLRDKNGKIIYALLQGQQQNTYLKQDAYREGIWYRQDPTNGNICGQLVDKREYPLETRVTATTDTTTTKVYGLTHKYRIGQTAPGSDTSTANSFYNSLRNDNTPARGITFYDLDMVAGNFPDLDDYQLYAAVCVIDPSYRTIEELTNVVSDTSDAAHYTLYHPFLVSPATTNLPTAVGQIGDDQSDEPVIYYNLQGMAVPAPTEPGIYLRRQGDTVTKVIVK